MTVEAQMRLLAWIVWGGLILGIALFWAAVGISLHRILTEAIPPSLLISPSDPDRVNLRP
jgi:hypothetical protein